MIQNKSLLRLADNSGAIIVECIRRYKPKHRLKIGSFILVIIKKVRLQPKLKVGLVHKAIIIRAKQKLARQNGNYLQFADNSVVLLNLKNEYYGTRLLGPVSTELRKKGILKILSLANYLF
jgi:large subunit ribosomal protein L14